MCLTITVKVEGSEKSRATANKYHYVVKRIIIKTIFRRLVYWTDPNREQRTCGRRQTFGGGQGEGEGIGRESENGGGGGDVRAYQPNGGVGGSGVDRIARRTGGTFVVPGGSRHGTARKWWRYIFDRESPR